MEKAKQKKASSFDFHKAAHKVKEFFHPANVTWKKPKETTHDSAIVLGVVVIAAVLLAAGDAVFGIIMNLLL